MFYCAHRLKALLQPSFFIISRPKDSYPLTRRLGKINRIYDTGFVDRVVLPRDGAKAFVQGLRTLTRERDDAAKRAQYQKYTTEKVQKWMRELQDDSNMAPAIKAYYQASTAPAFRDEATTAFRRRLGSALKDILNSIEYDQLYRQISTNLRPALS